MAALWQDTLTELISSIKAEDQRMVWLKDQYLFLYYQDDLCMGPLAADAIKVNTCLLYSLILTEYYRGSKVVLDHDDLLTQSRYRISANSFRGNYSFLNLEIIENSNR